MEFPFRPLSLNDVINRTFLNLSRRRRYEKLVADADREKRLLHQSCRCCFYGGGRIGGAAMTTAYCGLCAKELQFGSTAVDALCVECAKGHRLCRQCGSDVEDKNRRKL